MRQITKFLMCLGLFLGVTAATSLNAATSTFQNGVNGYTGTVDTHVRDSGVNVSEANNVIFLTDGENPISHAMIRFDNIFGLGPGQVPPDATITSAFLVLRTANNGNTVNFYRMLVPWEETNTWNVMVNGLSPDDVEMASAVEFATVDQAPVGTVSTNDVTAIVQGWLAGTFPNFGWGTQPTSTDGWQVDSSESGTIANRPMLIINFEEAMVRPVMIVQQPTGGTVNEGGTFTFSVIVAGTDPVYQWRFNDMDILGANSSSYTIPRVLRTDEGTYTVVVQNSITAPITSSGAFLDVIPDLTGPRVICAYATNNDNVTIFVQFSELVTGADALGNYMVVPAGGGTPLTIASAAYGGASATEGNVVVLTLDAATPWVAPGAYNLMFGNAITDLFGNAIVAGQRPIGLYSDATFGITESQIWTFNDDGQNIGDTWKERIYNDSAWKSGPALIGFETAALPEPLRTPADRLDDVGTVIRTFYFRTHFNYGGPAGDGTLRFRTVLDDSAAIYLNGVEIFRNRLPAGPLDYLTPGAGDAVGDAVYEGPFTACATNLLVGDNVIAVEVHQTGGNSSDMVWGMDLASVIPQITPCSIVTQPVGTNITVEGSPFTLRVVAGGSNPRYQWQLNDVDILDATNATYAVAQSDCEVHAGMYRVIVRNDAPSECTSASVNVTITCDTLPPVVACVYGTNDTIVVVFNELTTNGLEFFNFTVEPATDGAAVAVATNFYTSGTDIGTTVLVVIDGTTPLTPDKPYNVTVQGIADLFGNTMPAPVTLAIPLFSSASLLSVPGSQWRYETSGTDLSNTWYAVGYNDGAWPLGSAVFDAEREPRTEVGGYPVGTQTTLSNAANTAQIPTHYFRTHFNYSGPATATLQLTAVLDDGAVYYLNGREILRIGMPAAPAPILFNTLANRTVGDATNEFLFACVTNLVNGDNLLAVEAHQVNLTSSDLTFATGINVYSTTPLPRLSIAPGPGAGEVTITWTVSGTLQRSASLSTPNWQNVGGVVGNSFTTQATGMGFFRLTNP
ncbi:MAG: DNRLRE domain-containing protein [Verrucomicrobia subdivision 3 bacterium]|nr:DNRLRE domain-containing protein [Limisphaerales bacterium]